MPLTARVVHIDPRISGKTPVFARFGVPSFRNLTDHLERDRRLYECDDSSRAQALAAWLDA